MVTYNRASLLTRMLAGLAALDRAPDAVIVVDNASTDHTATVLDAASIEQSDLKLQVIRPEENLGGAGGFHAGVEAAYEQGFDRIWLMDDDVVPAPDCLDVLMAVDEDCLMAVREDTAGRLVEKAAVTFDLRNPLRIRPKTAMVETTYGARERMPELVEIQNVAFEGFLVRRARGRGDRPAGPRLLHLLRRRRLRPPGPPRRLQDLGRPRRGPRPPARLRPAARPVGVEGLLHVPQPLHRAPAVRRERHGPRQAVADHRGRGRAVAPARRPRRGPQRPPGAQGRASGCRAETSTTCERVQWFSPTRDRPRSRPARRRRARPDGGSTRSTTGRCRPRRRWRSSSSGSAPRCRTDRRAPPRSSSTWPRRSSPG